MSSSLSHTKYISSKQSFKKGILEKGLDLGGPLVSIGVGNDALYKLANEPFLSIELTSENAKYSFVYHVDGESLVASFLPLYETFYRVSLILILSFQNDSYCHPEKNRTIKKRCHLASTSPTADVRPPPLLITYPNHDIFLKS